MLVLEHTWRHSFMLEHYVSLRAHMETLLYARNSLPPISQWLFGFWWHHYITLCYVSVCKMAAVVYPLRPPTVVTERCCYFIIFFNWTVTLVFAAPFYFLNVSLCQCICFAQWQHITGKDYMFAMICGLGWRSVPMCVCSS